MSRLAAVDIANLPGAEDQWFEYKSSRTTPEALKEKIASAASGFWNSGGGLFIAGVDGAGKLDGGISRTVSRQPLRDWIDQVVHKVTPAGKYQVLIIEHDPTSGLNIAEHHCVAAIEFEESSQPPHMAPDCKYYIRAGAHTVPATQYIVEALWARRRAKWPQLAHTMRLKPDSSETVQLGIVALTDEPAVAVSIVIDPLPEMWKNATHVFPLKLPLVDRSTPFYLDLMTFHAAEERLGRGVQLKIEYRDVADNRYKYDAAIDAKALTPWKIGTPAIEKMGKSLESIDKSLKDVPKALAALGRENAELRAHFEAWKRAAVPRRASEPRAIMAQLSPDAVQLMLAGKEDGDIRFMRFLGGSHVYAGKRQFTQSPGDPREEAKWMGVIAELRDAELIDGVFEREGGYFRLNALGYRVADAATDTETDPSK